MGMLSYIALEVLIRTKHHFRSGVDDALLLICGCLFVTGFAIMLIRTDNDYVLLSLILFLLNLCFTARFADTLMSALCCMAFLAFVFFGWTNAVAWGMATIPFVMMLVSGGLYWICLTFLKQKKLADYQNCFITAQTIALLALYISGNFYVIQRLSVEMNGQNGSKIPFAAYFWIWTMAVPLIYVGLGIRHKNRILGRIGLLLIACAVETFRTYYHLFPLDIALAAGGALILGIVYVIMRYLKTPRYGFTYSEPEEEKPGGQLKVESLIVAETFAASPAASAGDAARFGGGDFGGGGSRSGF